MDNIIGEPPISSPHSQVRFTSCTSKINRDINDAANGVGKCVVIIMDVIEAIPDYALKKYNFQHFTVPSSVRTIGEGAFSCCKHIESIVILNFTTVIAKKVFYRTLFKKSVFIPDSVTSIGRMAFENCTNLTSITLLFRLR